MKSSSQSDRLTGQRYETIFCIFLLVLVFLYRENAQLIYPQILYLLALLLAVNLVTGWIIQRWNAGPLVAASAVISNCAVITAILTYSGGSDSMFWVLYLLPIYTVCLLLNGFHLVLIVAGIIGFNLVFESLYTDRTYSSLMLFNLGVKAGLFVFASAGTWKIAQRDRRSKEKMDFQRRDMQDMEGRIKQQQVSLLEFEKMADVEQLASGIAHDLRNPIAVIFGTAKMLLEDNRVDPFRADLERITRAAELCTVITSNVSDFTRNKDRKNTSCDLNELFNSALEIYQPMLTEANIKVEKQFAPNLPHILGNHTLLERVLLNLIANAKSAMKQNGTLTLRTNQDLLCSSGVSWIHATVQDTGPGLNPEILGRIFKPFNTTKAAGEGTGLGLYLSQQIAQKHNGRLSVENLQAGGAQFVLSLPCLASEEQAPQASANSNQQAA